MAAWPIKFVEGSKFAKKNRNTDSNYRRKITKKPEEIVNFKLNGKTGAVGEGNDMFMVSR